MAIAGLLRLGLDHRITQRLDPGVFPYAVGQGSLGIEVRNAREDIIRLVLAADYKPSRWRGMAERAMLRSLQGGCSSPVGVSSFFAPPRLNDAEDAEEKARDGGLLHLHATVLDMEGTMEIRAKDAGLVWNDDEAEQLGISVAHMLIQRGAQSLLSKNT